MSIALQVRVKELGDAIQALQASLAATNDRLAELHAGLSKPRPLTARGRARALLRDLLLEGPRLVSECIELGTRVGIGTKTMRLAAADIGARPVRLPVPGRGRCWHWEFSTPRNGGQGSG